MRQREEATQKRNVGIVALPGAQALEVAGPFDVFRRAELFGAKQGVTYDTTVYGLQRGTINTRGGLTVSATSDYTAAKNVDTVLVVGGFETPSFPLAPPFLRWLRRIVSRTRRVCGVCAGAFALAEAGLLKRRRAVCHWGHADLFRERYPDVLLDPDPIFVRDGHLYTSAGVTAGIDLALALVEEDFGRALALEVACSMVVFLRRPGTQSQFSHQLAMQLADKEPIRDLQNWMQDNLDADLSVAALASRVGMSQRHFARVFAREVGMTPSRFVEKLRVDGARRRLEQSSQPLKIIAEQVGIGSIETLRRYFSRRFRTSPDAYRERFQSSLVH